MPSGWSGASSFVAELDSTSLYVMRRHRADALGPIYGIAPEVVAKAGEYFREQLRHVEVALSDGRQFLMGDKFTSADILLTTCLDWAIAYGVGICDNAHPYLERIQAREAYQLATAANVPLAPIVPVQAKGLTTGVGRATARLKPPRGPRVRRSSCRLRRRRNQFAQHPRGLCWPTRGAGPPIAAALTSKRAAGFGCRTRPTIG